MTILICEYDSASGKQYNRQATEEEAYVLLNQKAEVPSLVGRKAALLALARADLLVPVQAYLDSLNEPTKTEYNIEWTESLTFSRYSPVVLDAATALGLTNEQLDDLFITAKTLE